MKSLLPEVYLHKWNLWNIEKQYLQEIRLRVGQPLILTYKGKEVLWEKVQQSDLFGPVRIVVTKKDMEEIFAAK